MTVVSEDAIDRQQRLQRIVAEAVVRPSFLRCCEHGEPFIDAFYAGLAGHIPGVGALFANTDMQKQNALVREGILTLIDYAAGQSSAVPELERLGGLHARDQLNIPPEMYSGWVDAMVETVAEHDPQATDAVEAAWREVLAPGVDVMMSRY